MRPTGNIIKSAILVCLLALGLLIGSAEQSNAAYYPGYYNSYSYYYSFYTSTGKPSYYYWAQAFLLYWDAGYYGDYYGYNSDTFGAKSPDFKGSTPEWDAQWDYYSYYGDLNAYYGNYYYSHGS